MAWSHDQSLLEFLRMLLLVLWQFGAVSLVVDNLLSSLL